jgi:hypothetical protein
MEMPRGGLAPLPAEPKVSGFRLEVILNAHPVDLHRHHSLGYGARFAPIAAGTPLSATWESPSFQTVVIYEG